MLVGTGFVGMSFAYSMLSEKGIDELVLVDVNEDKAKGEQMDLNDGLVYADTKMKISAGSYADAADTNIVVLTAGAAQKRPGLRQIYPDEASGARRTGERRTHPAHPLRQRPRQSGRGGVPAAETRHHRRHRAPCGGAGSPRRRRAGAEFVPHH